MMNQEVNVLRELEFFLDADLPPEALEAWYEALSAEEKAQVHAFVDAVLGSIKSFGEE